MSEIIKPIENIDSFQQAGWLLQILSATYGHHNLSSSIEKIETDIQGKKLKPFFTIEGSDIANCCALIFSDQAVEIGRAANAPEKNGGGRLMLQAVDFWRKKVPDKRPLVAEIRMAGEFEGIAGGQGSQATLLGKVGMIPHAFLPIFHHPGPLGIDRQEFFCFSYLEKQPFERIAPRELILPNDPKIDKDLLANLLDVCGFETTVTSGEFPKISREIIPKRIGADNPFEFVSVDSFDLQLGGVVSDIIDQGFIFSGISSPHLGPLQLLFGRLDNCLLAPTVPMRNFPLINESLIKDLDTQYRQQR